MSNEQASINAENKLNDAIAGLRSQIKIPEKKQDIVIEEIKNTPQDVDVFIEDNSPPIKEPARSEFVKTDDPQVLARINDLYRQAKQSDKRNQMILEHNKLMEEKLAEYQEKLSRFEQETKNTNTSKVESELNQAIRVAWEEGDFDKAATLNTKLLDLKAEKIKEEIFSAQKPEPKKIQIDPQKQQFETQLIHNAAYIENLATEKDSNGNLVRPYLYDWHPDNSKAVELFESVPKEFAAAGKQVDIGTIMKVVDERIQGKKSNKQASVLGGDGDSAPARKTIRLTQEEINVARKMGITPERYARQKQLMT